ncbi:MAG: PHP domain-containing protein [Candidatus Gastranaerophilaceae bacterium]
MKRADLHLHSNFSDGSDTVFELVEKIKNTGIEIFALTDHDTIEGHFEIEKIIPNGIKYVKGVELTCKAEGISSHILGYNYNPQDLALANLIEKGKQLRKIKLEKRIKYLKEVWNIELTQEEKEWLYSRKSVVKTHLANILVKRNLALDNVSAMKKYLDDCKTGNTKFETGEAVQILLNAGSIPVWAHPLGGEGEKHISKETFLNQLAIMKTYGIKGLECYYSRYNAEEQNFLTKCAVENNLLISGGSDYHGTNKTVPLGRLNTNDILIDCSKLTVLNELK